MLSSFAETPAAAEALLAIAELQFQQQRSDEVVATTERLVKGFPTFEGTARALVLQARSQWQSANALAEVAQLEALLRRVINMFPAGTHPGLEARTQARVLLGELGLLLGDFDEAAAVFLEAIETEQVSEWTARARFGFAQAMLHRPTRTDSDVLAALQALQMAVTEVSGADADLGGLGVEASARDLLTLLHRVWVRPRASQSFWTSASTVAGIQLKKPRGVDGGPGGSLAVTDSAATHTVDGRGNLQSQPSRDGRKPTFGRNGVLFLPTAGAIRELPSGRSESFSFLREKRVELDKIEAGGRGALGEWLVLDRGLGTVAVMSREERSLRELPPDRAPVADVAIGSLGKIYVLLQKEPRILIYRPDFQLAGRIDGAWRRAIAIDVDLLGNVYVLDRATPAIEVRNPQGQVITSVGPMVGNGIELRDVVDLAVDDRGRLLVVDTKITSVVVLE